MKVHAGSRVRLAPYLFVAPFFLVFAVFGLFPIIASFLLSLTNWQGVNGGDFIGLANYARLLSDNSFRTAFGHTVLMWLLVVPTLSFGGLVLAWITESRLVRFRRVLRTVFLLPVMPPLIVVAIIFLLLLDPTYGLPNQLLRAVGLGTINIRTSEGVALPVVATMVIWRWLGYNMTIHLAGLQSLPSEVIEAARVDGASAWRLFWRVVVPLSTPVLVFTAVQSTVGVFNIFDEPYVLFGTQGGPGEAGLMTGPLLYREAFQFFHVGYASAIAYALAAVVFIASLVQLRALRHESA